MKNNQVELQKMKNIAAKIKKNKQPEKGQLKSAWFRGKIWGNHREVVQSYDKIKIIKNILNDLVWEGLACIL